MCKVSARMPIRNERSLSREVLRALKFMEGQLRKGWNYREVFNQIETSYGKRVQYFVALAIDKNLTKQNES